MWLVWKQIYQTYSSALVLCVRSFHCRLLFHKISSWHVLLNLQRHFSILSRIFFPLLKLQIILSFFYGRCGGWDGSSEYISRWRWNRNLKIWAIILLNCCLNRKTIELRAVPFSPPSWQKKTLSQHKSIIIWNTDTCCCLWRISLSNFQAGNL